MKLACLILRPWLIPYTNGTLQTDRPALSTRIARHLDDCSTCRMEATRLESNDAILHGYAARSRSSERQNDAGTRGKPLTPLSSRVLASIQSDEKFHSSHRWSPNGLSFATAALGVAAFVTIINPQSGVFGMIHNFLVPPSLLKTPAPVRPSYPSTGPVTYHPMGPATTGGIRASDGTASGISESAATHGHRDVVNGLDAPAITNYPSNPQSSHVVGDGPSDTITRNTPIAVGTANDSAAVEGQTGDDNGAAASKTVMDSTTSLRAVGDISDNHPTNGALSNYLTSESSSTPRTDAVRTKGDGLTPPDAPDLLSHDAKAKGALIPIASTYVAPKAAQPAH